MKNERPTAPQQQPNEFPRASATDVRRLGKAVFDKPWLLWGVGGVALVATVFVVIGLYTDGESEAERKARILESLRAPTDQRQQVTQEEKARILESLKAPTETTGTGGTGGTTETSVSEEEKARILESLRAPAE